MELPVRAVRLRPAAVPEERDVGGRLRKDLPDIVRVRRDRRRGVVLVRGVAVGGRGRARPGEDDHLAGRAARVLRDPLGEVVLPDDVERGGDGDAVEVAERPEDGEDGVAAQERVHGLRLEHGRRPVRELDEAEHVDGDACTFSRVATAVRKLRDIV